MVKAHGTTGLRSGRVLETEYRPGSVGPGMLSLRHTDPTTFESTSGQVRLDPWIADEYQIIELEIGNYFMLCGAQAVVAVEAASLAWLSSIALEYQEGETIDLPWSAESQRSRLLVLATERRVWCLDERGAIRWVWSCTTGDQNRWISDEPVIAGDLVRVPLRTVTSAPAVELRLGDGLPTGN